MFQLAASIVYGSALEWWTHKYVLHGSGKNKQSFWSFHWRTHHRACRKNAFYDADYEVPFYRSEARLKEVIGIAGLGLVHLPLLPIAPVFTTSLMAQAAIYYFVHKKSHLNPEWARHYLPWHYDHPW